MAAFHLEVPSSAWLVQTANHLPTNDVTVVLNNPTYQQVQSCIWRDNDIFTEKSSRQFFRQKQYFLRHKVLTEKKILSISETEKNVQSIFPTENVFSQKIIAPPPPPLS